MFWLLLLVFLVIGVVAGYLTGVLTTTPLIQAWQERQRVEQEARLAELQLRHLSHQAMQRLLLEARTER